MSKRWTIIFRTLSNINRLKIVQMLSEGDKLTVTQVAAKLNISLKATSKHLLMLKSLDVLDSDGKIGHVFYSLNPNPPRDFQQVIKLIT